MCMMHGSVRVYVVVCFFLQLFSHLDCAQISTSIAYQGHTQGSYTGDMCIIADHYSRKGSERWSWLSCIPEGPCFFGRRGDQAHSIPSE